MATKGPMTNGQRPAASGKADNQKSRDSESPYLHRDLSWESSRSHCNDAWLQASRGFRPSTQLQQGLKASFLSCFPELFDALTSGGGAQPDSPEDKARNRNRRKMGFRRSNFNQGLISVGNSGEVLGRRRLCGLTA